MSASRRKQAQKQRTYYRTSWTRTQQRHEPYTKSCPSPIKLQWRQRYNTDPNDYVRVTWNNSCETDKGVFQYLVEGGTERSKYRRQILVGGMLMPRARVKAV